ncbi:bifunctional methylenetetrahydrofolate dehydrogenase/methenyltetrahydrofolate cyclohydrolase FolD [Listeria welshimeri]|uniref:Bifunctional protein FolD n=1 Tax=Listeria welshimeri serovar 6b (strain ATCC 35897 / DSM 20650 / CCUG 15529 / CIP 8149 / NCTC 11857 / SLCC 5334 / V8) TaxID=386043 RepID=FOLD_LISW6|nr:bifunctional methylenetetrahydrofolate dehydrogenase/methenyltetrahydrofolate cyclohydrolase FolD [Listeria welshimeri]A0AIG1.1 RecName: Full=Bifunctional protein FolD; Includes: RecName: Full=Methylenetetrahydrofolate dehydrogenase; Includes: RecName: Full=Methenyltetrahydrofolate cyclohydrolase [Listeria welshimeri serovar 6b str. SLCC5334]CAK20793.1 methylenetetrahydrofolate dehydrogenase (NADP+) / methenyltetrahydrofolate cyclohydrolase [Listeria welshimeri serovar 6b str. SLCC5334]SNV237
MGQIIDGEKLAKEIQERVTTEVAELAKIDKKPGLAVVLVGDNQASRTYVRNKQKRTEEAGMKSVLIELPETVSEEKLLEVVEELNTDDTIHGILVQLPLPKHISEEKVIDTISYDKDVDGFHPVNVGNLFIGKDSFVPCTPAGIIELIKSTGTQIEGKRAVVIGRSNIVGKPVAQLLLNENATVTIAHSRTKNLPEVAKEADILVVATGLAKFVKKEYIKPGAIVIDVGMDRDENNKLCGDVDFDDVIEEAGFITPVPGGVGPMTITMLLANTLKAAKRIWKMN